MESQGLEGRLSLCTTTPCRDGAQLLTRSHPLVVELAELRAVIRGAEDATARAYAYTGGGIGNDGGIVEALDRLQGLRVKSEKTLPAIMSDGQLEAASYPVPPMLIEGVMHVGRRTLLLAPSKASKTWTAMDISVSVASGTPWLGFRTNRAKVLHIDLELPTWGLKERLKKLKEVRGIVGEIAHALRRNL
jgi:hypothetical protein